MTILIAEDDKETRLGLKEILETEGYRVEDVPDGNRALSLFDAVSPDMVILDIMMAGLSGYDVCRAIRKKNNQIPILFLSARAEEIDKVVGLELGADDYVVKPFGIREISARVKALLRRVQINDIREESLPSEIKMDDLILYQKQLRAQRRESSIALTEKEMGILLLLFRNRGDVVSKDRFFDEVWGLDYVPNSRTLDQTISQLRKKIEINPSLPRLIKTVHSAGFRWEG